MDLLDKRAKGKFYICSSVPALTLCEPQGWAGSERGDLPGMSPRWSLRWDEQHWWGSCICAADTGFWQQSSRLDPASISHTSCWSRGSCRCRQQCAGCEGWNGWGGSTTCIPSAQELLFLLQTTSTLQWSKAVLLLLQPTKLLLLFFKKIPYNSASYLPASGNHSISLSNST